MAILTDDGGDEMRKLLMMTLAGSTLLLADASHAQQQRQHQSTATSERPLTVAERQAAWSSHKVEYRRRLARDGQASADRWLDSQARAMRGEPRSQPRARTGKKDCKKVRWVNRATPGFGGGPMTMSRVAVCAD
jgi:hypothetical protein